MVQRSVYNGFIETAGTFKPLNLFDSVVRMEGLEPPHLAASDPKSDVSTNFTTSGLVKNPKRQITDPCLFDPVF